MTILASVTGLGSDRTVLEAAVAVARIDGGHIDCLHTRIDAVEATALMAAASPRQNTDVHGLLRKISDEEAVWLSKDIARRIENELEYPGQIKVTVIRETRATDYAK